MPAQPAEGISVRTPFWSGAGGSEVGEYGGLPENLYEGAADAEGGGDAVFDRGGNRDFRTGIVCGRRFAAGGCRDRVQVWKPLLPFQCFL